MPEPYNSAPSIERIFEAVVTLDRERRAAILDSLCAGRPSVRREADELLNAYDRSGVTVELWHPVDPRYVAEALLVDSMTAIESSQGTGSPMLAVVTSRLGVLISSSGWHGAAVSVLREAVVVFSSGSVEIDVQPMILGYDSPSLSSPLGDPARRSNN